MIYDKVENLEFYFGNNEKLEKLVKAYKDFEKAPFESGRIDIDSDISWCNVSKYETKSPEGAKLEAHKEYFDVQLMFEGSEKIGWAPVSECTVTDPFKDGDDIAFMTSNSMQFISLKKGYFAVFFPQDAHMPCICDGESKTAHKLVFKCKTMR